MLRLISCGSESRPDNLCGMTDLDAQRYPYQALVRTVQHSIDSGKLEAGDKLPSIRELAREHNVTPATVARAIRELNDSGVVTTVPGLGVFVTDTAASADRELTAAQLVTQLDQIQLVVTDLASRVERLEKGSKSGSPAPARDRTTS